MGVSGFIRCYGNMELGIGHVVRSMILYRFLRKGGIEVRCLVYPHEIDELKEILGQNKIDVVSVAEPITPRGDFLIYDMPFIEHQFINAFRENNPDSKILALDFFDYGNERIDVVLNLFNHGDSGAMVNNRHTRFISGHHIALLREGFYKHRDEQRKLSKHIKSILVTFGGADPRGNTAKFLSRISVFDSEKLVVVCGPMFVEKDRIKRLAEHSRVKVQVVGPVDDIEKLMIGSDLVVCSGGTTMLEAMFLGCPVIVVPQTELEQRFAEDTAAKGGCIVADFEAEGDFEAKVEAVRSYGLRRTLSHGAMRLVKAEGAKIVVEEIRRHFYESS
jgi:UDP-2,4-diacetamido-2,4,6-trideoxy-beta-L-altropyranose hydrolase